MALQGYAAPRDEFPSWMIPPIEYNCRCFLEILEVPRADAKLSQIKGSAKDLVKPKQLNSVYSESLAKCGRILLVFAEKGISLTENAVGKRGI